METQILQMTFGLCYLIGIIAIGIIMETKSEKVKEITGVIAFIMFVAPVAILIINLLIRLL